MRPLGSLVWRALNRRKVIASVTRPAKQVGSIGEVQPRIDTGDAFGVFAISAAARTGLDELKLAWWRRLLEMRKLSVQPVTDVELP